MNRNLIEKVKRKEIEISEQVVTDIFIYLLCEKYDLDEEMCPFPCFNYNKFKKVEGEELIKAVEDTISKEPYLL